MFEKNVVLDQAVRGFQLRPLKTELNKARENKANLDARADSIRSKLCQTMHEKMLSSVAFNIRLSIRKVRLERKLRLDAKLKKLSVRQDRPLKEQEIDSTRTLYRIGLPHFVEDLLFYGPKHPIRDNFKKVHSLADIDKLIRTLRESGNDCKKLCANEASAERYA